MIKFFKSFLFNEEGAVTVDWVVICAGIVAMCVVVVAVMQAGTLGLTDGIANYLGGFL
ncbi:hypothetical protein [Sulfitobacter sp. SK012]|uniref:hypothetical protein n=1 Tax=Sulfitobacter sp. SK012 TaxID=1389005 RepID=UPI0013B47267|nr:hypothetical protein [Sulfitobacter sp. SK012]